MRVLGIIPARGGSKGVPRKNIRPLGALPLIAYSIQASQQSCLTDVIVSTDCEEIANVARKCGGVVPFLRPADLATDTANAITVLQHAVRFMEKEKGETYDAVMMLQPTSPFRRAKDINDAVEILDESGADSVISVIASDAHPERMKYMKDGRLIDPPFSEAYENQPRQELPEIYLRSGAIYLTTIKTLEQNSLKGIDSRGLVVAKHRAVNIDTIFDFEFAEWLLTSGRVEQ